MALCKCPHCPIHNAPREPEPRTGTNPLDRKRKRPPPVRMLPAEEGTLTSRAPVKYQDELDRAEIRRLVERGEGGGD